MIFKNSKINFASADYDNRKQLLKRLKGYDGVTVGKLAKSFCGRDIDFISFGQQENSVLLCGAFHAMENITALLLIAFAFDFAKNLSADIAKKLTKTGLFIVPCINPDGVEIFLHGIESAGRFKSIVSKASNGDVTSWQANARGVDLNHNFDALWDKLHEIERKNGILFPASTRYGGEYPESEAETQAIVKLCKQLNFKAVLAFHSQGEEIYWNFNNIIPDKAEELALQFSRDTGYKLSSPTENLASYGGFKDWFISYFNKPGFTFEVGKGKNPLPISDLENIYGKLRKMLFSLIDI